MRIVNFYIFIRVTLYQNRYYGLKLKTLVVCIFVMYPVHDYLSSHPVYILHGYISIILNVK